MIERVFFVYLNIDAFPAAWAAYRGYLISSSVFGTATFRPVSYWVARLLKDNKPVRFQKELLVEKIRRQYYPNLVSRLHGMYFWGDEESARHAEKWREKEGHYFDRDYLVETGFTCVKPPTRVDTTWIDDYLINDEVPFDAENTYWIHEYWKGNPQPSKEAKWEYIVEGKGIVWGTKLRTKAYQKIAEKWPHLLGQLEIARIAALMMKDINHCAPFIRRITESEVKIEYYMDQNGFNDNFVKEFGEFIKKQPPNEINWKALQLLKDEQKAPDLRGLEVIADLRSIHPDIKTVLESIVSSYHSVTWLDTHRIESGIENGLEQK